MERRSPSNPVIPLNGQRRKITCFDYRSTETKLYDGLTRSKFINYYLKKKTLTQAGIRLTFDIYLSLASLVMLQLQLLIQRFSFSISRDRIRPKKFQKILLDTLQESIPDVSVSRPASRVHWAIRVPNDESHSIYVWLDALVNYLTCSGYPNEEVRVDFINLLTYLNLPFHFSF